jgi:hypothetical protein
LLGGLVAAAAGLVALFRLTRQAPKPVPAAGTLWPAAPLLRNGWLAQTWPLLAASLLYLPLIGAEFFYSRSPDQAVKPLLVSAAPWEEPHRWRYEIRNIADTVVGEGECQLDKDGTVMRITCSSQVAAYEVKRSTSTYASSGGTRTDQTSWQAVDGRLISGSTRLILLDGTYTSETAWTVGGDAVHIRRQENGGKEEAYSLPFSETQLAKNSELLLAPDYTWPWQLAGIRLEQGESGSVVRFSPYTWRNKTRDNGPVAEARVIEVKGTEEVATPAGRFTAWKVVEGKDEIAWVKADGSHTPVKFFNGIETWSLK